MTSDSSANRFLQHLQMVYGITSYTVTEKTQVKQVYSTVTSKDVFVADLACLLMC